jgi:hypothetical protein
MLRRGKVILSDSILMIWEMIDGIDVMQEIKVLIEANKLDINLQFKRK